jgi:hypothetical protein
MFLNMRKNIFLTCFVIISFIVIFNVDALKYEGSVKVVTSSSTMIINGDKKFVNTKHSEEYRNRDDESQPTQVRKFNYEFRKENDNPGIVTKQADTNVRNEKIIIGDQPDIKLINSDENVINFNNLLYLEYQS